MNKKTYLLAFVLTAIAIFQLLYLPRMVEEIKNENDVLANSAAVYTPTMTSPTTAMSEDNVFEYYTGPYTCEVSGISKTGQGILDTYIVKKGDSLLSIVNTLYDNTAKVGDVIYLNKNTYASLTVNPNLLGIGWKLLLPESDMAALSEGFEIASGQVYILKAGEVAMKLGKDSAIHSFYPNKESTIMPELKLGDCVHVFEKNHSKVFKIDLQ